MFCLTCKRISLGGTNFTNMYTVSIDLLQTWLFNRGEIKGERGPHSRFYFAFLLNLHIKTELSIYNGVSHNFISRKCKKRKQNYDIYSENKNEVLGKLLRLSNLFSAWLLPMVFHRWLFVLHIRVFILHKNILVLFKLVSFVF